MNPFLSVMAEKLSDFDRRELQRIHNPRVVGIPPEYAGRGLSVLPDGELRHYGHIHRPDFNKDGDAAYLASRDCGLSWKYYPAAPNDPYRYATCIPWTGRYISAFDVHSDVTLSEPRPPLPMQSRRRLLAVSNAYRETHELAAAVSYSDDDGVTWRTVVLDSAPKHTAVWPHKGLRWQNHSCEPTVAELSDGSLYLLARTSTDFLYEYRSYDGGETWSAPKASAFHATLTMPTLYTLSDGRLLLLWCNTRPLPELDHTAQTPALYDGEISGEHGEDVFTNRDANHAAISDDDGKTWHGFRELGLNDIRNFPDFRSHGDGFDSIDKSVHQFQALELPYGKVLVAYGQHHASRRMVIFDPAWLYETSRREDFRFGMGALSTQVYLKSVSGNYRGFAGHCAWNRLSGAVLMPDPEGTFGEALFLSRTDDPRLFSQVQGAVWNFSISKRGQVTVRLRIEGPGVALSLADAWFNPIDETVRKLAAYSVDITPREMGAGFWTDLALRWNEARVDVLADGQYLFSAAPNAAMPYGICYLHMQTLATSEDRGGCYIKTLEMIAEV